MPGCEWLGLERRAQGYQNGRIGRGVVKWPVDGVGRTQGQCEDAASYLRFGNGSFKGLKDWAYHYILVIYTEGDQLWLGV